MPARIKRCVTPVMAAMGAMSICTVLAAGNQLPLLMGWPLVYMLCGCLCVQLRGKWRLIAGVLLGGGMIAVSVLWYLQTWQPLSLITGIVLAILLLATLPLRDVMVHAVVVGGLGLHVLTQLFLNLMAEPLRQATYGPVEPIIHVSLVIFLALALLTLNGFSLSSAMPEGKHIPITIRRRNRAITWLMLIVSLAIAFIPALGRWLDALWNWIRHAIAALIMWLFSKGAEEEAIGGAGGDTMDLSGLGEGSGPSELALWLEKILLVVVSIALVFIVVWAGRKLWQKLCILMRWLFQRMQNYAASATEDYVDELQDTRDQGEARFSLRQWTRRRISAKEINALPPRERIRAKYGLSRTKHPEWADSATARETLDESSARIYERARYSTHEVTEGDAQKFMP